ncbi:hypothetical protein Tco_0446009 [Tanacetum coccineum]
MLEEEKARRRGKVFNWEIATYGKIWYDEEVHKLRSIETEFPAIVFDDAFTSKVTHFCEPTVSPLNDNKIDFRILFDESDDEDYTNEFPIIVYNVALTSKPDFSTEPFVIPLHIDEFDLKNETSLSECNEEEQNVLYFNDLYPFNVIYPHELKSDTGNDNDKIDIEQPSEDMSVKQLPDLINTDVGAYAHGSNKLLETIIMEYLVNISKRYGISVPALTKDQKATRLIRRIQRRSIRHIHDIVCEYSGRYQAWSLLQETPIRRI